MLLNSVLVDVNSYCKRKSMFMIMSITSIMSLIAFVYFRLDFSILALDVIEIRNLKKNKPLDEVFTLDYILMNLFFGVCK